MHTPSFYSPKKRLSQKFNYFFPQCKKLESKKKYKQIEKQKEFLTKSHQQLKFLLIWLMV